MTDAFDLTFIFLEAGHIVGRNRSMMMAIILIGRVVANLHLIRFVNSVSAGWCRRRLSYTSPGAFSRQPTLKVET
jgi:hypothetical protein